MKPTALSTLNMKYTDRLKLAASKDATAEVLSQLCEDPHPNVRLLLAERVDLFEADYLSLANTTAFNIRLNLAQNPATPASVLRSLAQPDDIRLLRALAKRDSLPPDLQMKLIKYNDITIRRILARNWNLCFDAMDALISQNDEEVMEALARSIRTPPSVLHKLAIAGGGSVRRRVMPRTIRAETLITLHNLGYCETKKLVKHCCCPDAILRQYSSHKDEIIRARVAKNSSTMADILEKLSSDPVASVREGLAGNSEIPLELLRKLANDRAASVRLETTYNKKLPLDSLVLLISDTDKRVRDVASRHRLVSHDLLQKLTNPFSRDANMKNALKNAKLREQNAWWNARNPAATASDLEAYSKSEDRLTLRSLAENTSCPRHVLDSLSSHEWRYVREAVALNPSTPPETLSKLAEDVEPPIRGCVGLHPSTLESDLRRLSKDKNYWVRLKLTRRSDISDQVLSNLAEDSVIMEWLKFNRAQLQAKRPVILKSYFGY